MQVEILSLFSDGTKNRLRVIINYLAKNPHRLEFIGAHAFGDKPLLPRLSDGERKMVDDLMKTLKTDVDSSAFQRAAIKMAMNMGRS